MQDDEKRATFGYMLAGAVTGYVWSRCVGHENLLEAPLICGLAGLAFGLIRFKKPRKISEIRKEIDEKGNETTTIYGKNTTTVGEVSRTSNSIVKNVVLGIVAYKLFFPVVISIGGILFVGSLTLIFG